MLAKKFGREITLWLAVLFLHLALLITASAQAWVPEKGEGSVTLTYQKTDVRYHYNSIGTKEDKGKIHSHTTIMALEYGLTDKLALDLDLAFVASKWIGQGRRPHGPLDNGFFHPMFQDAHIGLRYNALRRPLVVTPFIGVTVPTHDYEVRGHSAVGLGFKEFLVGVNVGQRLGRLLPNGYVQVRYSFAMHKRFAGLNLNRSNADWEVGWFANRSIAVRLIGNWQKTHGGFDFPEDLHTEDDFDIHDRVARANYLRLGAGVTFSVNRHFDIHAAYAPTPIYVRNTHGEAGIVIGFSWRFSRGSSDRIAVNTSITKPPTFGQGMF
ncbi:MAG TPA: hypothetical protein VIF64_05385 [Pyrinomonadaceae bacterium]|jgi:hypothetical protein